MSLSSYHQKYAERGDEEIEKRAYEKAQELGSIFNVISLGNDSDPVKVAVLGCADKRLIAHHKRIFEEILKRNVEVTTFDITIDHLKGGSNVFQHNCTLPLPNPPYNITYGHVLLKFIETEKQCDVLKNSYDALRQGGVAIHVLDREDYKTVSTKLPDGLWAVPLERWKEKLTALGIECKEIPVHYGIALVLLRS